jgi:cell cycle checkpoint protein
LEDNGIVTECSIVTQEADEVLDFDFTSSNVHSRLIIKSECLKEAFAEIDFTNNVLEMIMSPNEPNFKLITNGYIGTTQFDFSSSSEMIEVFECKKTQRNKYKLALLKPSIKGLHQSSKVSVRMDTRGFLSLQCMVITDDQQICFIEYLCVPAEDDEV